MELGESLEDYLEAIYLLSQCLERVRSVDIASYLGFSKPSVSHAVKVMESQKLITLDDNKIITLTNRGAAIEKEVVHRHKFFTDMLISMGVSKEIAQEDACRMEHVLSQESFNAIEKFYRKYRAEE